MKEYSDPMRVALEAAAGAGARGDTPVGAAVFRDDEIIAVAGNERQLSNDPSAHAEIVALRRAAESIGSWRLDGCGIAATLEPCPMCAGAILNARIDILVFGASDPKAGAAGTLYNICQDPRLNHSVEVVPGVLQEEAVRLLSDFFAAKRT